MDHPRPFRPGRTQDDGQPLGHPLVAHTHQLEGRPARVGQRAEQVEGRGHP